MLTYGYQVLDNYPADKKLQTEVSHHKYRLDEELDGIRKAIEEVQTHTRNADIYRAVRVIRQLRDLSQTLFNTCDHLLLSVENLTEPDHGGN